MKKYQYLVVDMSKVRTEKFGNNGELTYYEQIQSVLNELGDNGWELVQFEPIHAIYYLKREK